VSHQPHQRTFLLGYSTEILSLELLEKKETGYTSSSTPHAENKIQDETTVKILKMV